MATSPHLIRTEQLPQKRATTNGFPSPGSSRTWKVIFGITLSLCLFLVVVVVVFFDRCRRFTIILAKSLIVISVAKEYLQLDPFALRNSITYFNNNKEDSAKSAYERLHSVDFDLSKPRCDRTKPSLYWLEISKENQGHKVPMTTNLWYGRPNRVQVDFPGTKFNRSSKMQEFYIRCGFSLVSGEENGSSC